MPGRLETGKMRLEVSIKRVCKSSTAESRFSAEERGGKVVLSKAEVKDSIHEGARSCLIDHLVDGGSGGRDCGSEKEIIMLAWSDESTGSKEADQVTGEKKEEKEELTKDKSITD